MQTILESQNTEKKPIKRYLIMGTPIVIFLLWLVNSFLFNSANSSAVISAEGLALATVESGDLIQDIRAPGNLVAINRKWLSSRVSAKVVKRVLEPGAIVTPDSIILQLSSPELTQQYKRVKIEYKIAKAQLYAIKEIQITQRQKKQADVKLLEIEKQQAVKYKIFNEFQKEIIVLWLRNFAYNLHPIFDVF